MAHKSSFREGCLINHVALVTGGGSGIGKTIAMQLLEAGANVAILSRNHKRLNATSQEFMEQLPGRRCLAVAADVRDVKAMSNAVDRVVKELGRIDILVNCAAGNFLCPVAELSYNGFKTVFDIDAGGTFLASKLVYEKAFTAQSAQLDSPSFHRGTIINISMTLHYSGALYQSHAGAAKAAIDALTKHMAVEWGPKGVRVVGVAPGPIKGTEGFDRLVTTMNQSSTTATETTAESTIENYIPLQRLGTARDVGSLCIFLSVPDSFYITGHTIVVDGGQWLTSGNYALTLSAVRERWSSKQQVNSRL